MDFGHPPGVLFICGYFVEKGGILREQNETKGWEYI